MATLLAAAQHPLAPSHQTTAHAQAAAVPIVAAAPHVPMEVHTAAVAAHVPIAAVAAHAQAAAAPLAEAAVQAVAPLEVAAVQAAVASAEEVTAVAVTVAAAEAVASVDDANEVLTRGLRHSSCEPLHSSVYRNIHSEWLC